MDLPDGKLIINGAVSQYDRRVPALNADYAKVDGRSFSELLDFAIKFGSLINFYDLKDNVEGDWVLFFLTDPTMLLAAQEAASLSEIEAEFARLERLTLEAQSFDKKFDFLRDTFAVILAIARQLDLSLRMLRLHVDDETMRLLLQAIVAEIQSSLGRQLRQLKAYDLGAGLSGAFGRPIGLDYESFSPVWDLDHVAPDEKVYRGRTPNRKISHALPQLAQIFSSFRYAISDLKLFGQANLPTTLEAGDHKPQIALYIAFATLFRAAQDSINTFSSRYIRFYYRDILRESYRAAIPDRVYLAFALDESEDLLSTTVPRDTLFPAGQDKNEQDVLYGSDKDILVTSATIAKLSTLRVLCGKLVPQEPDSLLVVRSVLSSEIAIGTTADLESAWATFGQTDVGETEREVTKPATLGFAIASSYLSMTGGTRTVNVSFWCSARSLSKLIELLKELSLATSLPPDTIFKTVLLESFTLFVSMSAGWFQIENYTVGQMTLDRVNEPVFELQFDLPANVPPVVAYNPDGESVDDGSAKVVTVDPAVNATNPDSSLPTLKAYLRQHPVLVAGDSDTVGTQVYPISLLGEIEVTAFELNVEVLGLTGLQLVNTDGEIDPSSPFPIFGGLPVVGSYLLIRHTELFAKTLSSLWATISWFNLPPNEDGFQGYYKDYVIGLNGQPQPNLFNNAVFHGGMSIQNHGNWFLTGSSDCPSLPPAQVDVLLFRTGPYCGDTLPDGPLCSFTNFDKLRVCRSTPPPYYDPTESAIKLELTRPAYAFGNDLYAQNVLNSVLEDLPDTELCQGKCLSQCQVLLDASQCIEAGLICLAGCSQQSGDPASQCIDVCVTGCLNCLLDKAIQCLAECTDSSVGLPIEETLRRIIDRLEICMQQPDTEQVDCIVACTKLLAECIEIFDEEIPECAKECIEKCNLILEAIVCVFTYVDLCEEPVGAQCLIDGLTTCNQRLYEEYKACLETCMNDCLSLKKTIKYPNEPYLPQATSLTVNYSARCSSSPTESVAACGLFFHLLPLGGYTQLDLEEPASLLPHFSDPGNLYIGFSTLVQPQTLTLLFQMATEPQSDRSGKLPPVVWDYLSNNRWQRLQSASIQTDSTNGLQTTGIITLDLPTRDPINNTILSADNQWLRAAVAAQPDQFPQTINIYPHAVLASWRDNDNTGENLSKPLPPFTINSSVQDLPAIASIVQPIESFGGRPPETDGTFEIRVGERLRHKERAMLGWDYERLILERFPTVWKVQTLPARNLQRGDEPGNVLVVIIPGPDSIGVLDPTVPAASSEMLHEAQSYLEGLASPFIQLQVVNPIYVRIEVITSVQFQGASDAGAYVKLLNDELVQYLSPWFYDAARATREGRYISEADISEFIQTRPYVDNMFSIELGYEPKPQTLDWYFLTSAKQHQIHVT